MVFLGFLRVVGFGLVFGFCFGWSFWLTAFFFFMFLRVY